MHCEHRPSDGCVLWQIKVRMRPTGTVRKYICDNATHLGRLRVDVEHFAALAPDRLAVRTAAQTLPVCTGAGNITAQTGPSSIRYTWQWGHTLVIAVRLLCQGQPQPHWLTRKPISCIVFACSTFILRSMQGLSRGQVKLWRVAPALGGARQACSDASRYSLKCFSAVQQPAAPHAAQVAG